MRNYEIKIALLILVLFTLLLLAGFKISKQSQMFRELEKPLEEQNYVYTTIDNHSAISATANVEKSVITPPISLNDVYLLLNKLALSELKNGAVVELHISQSYSEVFIINVQDGIANVIIGKSPNEDLELWLTRSALEELLKTDDIPSTVKRLESEGKIAVKQKVSDWTLYRKGYKTLAEKLGLM